MAQFAVVRAAKADVAQILAASRERWGEEGRARYDRLLVAAMRMIARAPAGPMTRDHSAMSPGMRSLHLRHARRGLGVHSPVHVIYFQVTADLIEVIRVLHERMEPAGHIAPARTRRRPRQPR